MRYFSKRLADFDDICMGMRISHFNPIGDYKIRKFENPTLWTATILTRGSAMAERRRDTLVSRNSATTVRNIPFEN